jgi:DNA-binding NarL/FixJ family response regulator
VVGESEDSAKAMKLCHKSQPDSFLMHIRLPGMNGMATSELMRHCRASR